jgi:hypothetical protein
MDSTQDTGTSSGLDDGRWLTYRELAQARGIDVPSAVKLSRRQRWRRQAGNRNTVRIFVPLDWLSGDNDPETRDETRDATRADPGTRETDPGTYPAAFETALKAIEAAHASEVAALREQIVAAETARASMQGMVERFAGAVRDAEDAARIERARSTAEIADLRSDLDMARAQATTAHDAARALRQAEAERKVRGLLARLRAAVRGE